jgi:co-chaperonin GroES (HSP10)
MNKSGIKPFDDSIVVLVPSAENKTDGGILLADSYADREKYASKRVVIVDIGINAFNLYERERKKHCDTMGYVYERLVLPKVGDEVIITEYSGRLVKGEDKRDYRIVTAADIHGIIGE